MKTVFNKTSDVADLWAAQSQPGARTGSNTHFRGDSLFSYRTCIARHTVDINMIPVVLLSDGGYSSGTAKVIGEARFAARALGYRIFVVPYCDPMHAAANLQYFVDQVRYALAAIEKALKPDDRRKDAHRLYDQGAAFAEAFGLIWQPDLPEIDSVRSKRERAVTGERS